MQPQTTVKKIVIKKNGLIRAIIANIIDVPITKTKFGFSPSLNKTNIKDKKIKADPKSGCIRVNIMGIKITKKTWISDFNFFRSIWISLNNLATAKFVANFAISVGWILNPKREYHELCP